MPRDFSIDAVGGMLDDLKSRLGFSRDSDRDDARDYDGYDDYAEGYDDYDEYAEYADYDDGKSEAQSQAGAKVGGFLPAQVGTRTSRFGRPESSPNLVSFEDVKYSTSIPDRLQRDPLPPRGGNYASTTNVGGHTVIDTTVPAPLSPAYKAAMRDGAVRSDGSDALYGTSSSQMGSASSYDPYEAYSGTIPGSYSGARSLTVVKPTAYGDVERVARAVKSGDVVVLAMRSTPDDLSKRILDFSFGVASALDANVECPGDKVFAIAKGGALTEDEKRRLRAQAVL